MGRVARSRRSKVRAAPDRHERVQALGRAGRRREPSQELAGGFGLVRQGNANVARRGEELPRGADRRGKFRQLRPLDAVYLADHDQGRLGHG